MPRRGVRCTVPGVLRDVFRAVTRASAALDRGVVRVMERRMAGPAARHDAAIPDDAHRRLIALAGRYRDDTLGLPSRFFPTPRRPELRVRPVGEAFGGAVTELTWTSGYRPFLPEYKDEHHRWVENHTAHARRYTRAGGGAGATPRPVVIVFEQTCAAEKRRRRKRGLMDDPPRRVVINEMVCEGCGDCSNKSNCVSVLPVVTEWGTKREIDQSNCNKDYSCLNGFCPSFVTIEGGTLKKAKKEKRGDLGALPPIPEGERIVSEWAVPGADGQSPAVCTP